MMWGGSLYKSSFANHIDVVNISHDELLGIVYVTVVFDTAPYKEYVFEIDGEEFKPDKNWIAAEIQRQMQ